MRNKLLKEDSYSWEFAQTPGERYILQNNNFREHYLALFAKLQVSFTEDSD